MHCRLLVDVVNHVDTLIEEWYPRLADIDLYGSNKPLVERLVPCAVCRGKKLYLFYSNAENRFN